MTVISKIKVSGRRSSNGGAKVATILLACLILLSIGAGIYWKVNLKPVGWQQDETENLPIKTESLASYLEDPSTCATDLSDRYDKVSLRQKKGYVYDILLDGAEDQPPLHIDDVDLRVFVPHVPKIARGDEFLTHMTLVQRELNRNDTIFRGVADDGSVVNLANNCLREGLWEVYTTRVDGDNAGKTYHGWFEFPLPIYRKIFHEVNGFELDPYEAPLQHYQRPDGKVVNLSYLRKVESQVEIPSSEIDLNTDQPITHMGEQQAKAKLVVNPGILKYSDIYDRANQPIKLMQFDEPGIYKRKKLMKFDFSFLRSPEKVTLRKVHNEKLDDTFNELEIEFPYGERAVAIKNFPFLVKRNGMRLILGGWKLNDIPIASQRPIPAAEFGRFTFGIGTPDIYVNYERRLRQFDKPNNIYLMLVDKDDKYIDNHTTGIDQVYISRLPNDIFVMYTVSYERILLLTHWTFKPPQDVLVCDTTLANNSDGDCVQNEAKEQ